MRLFVRRRGAGSVQPYTPVSIVETAPTLAVLTAAVTLALRADAEEDAEISLSMVLPEGMGVAAITSDAHAAQLRDGDRLEIRSGERETAAVAVSSLSDQ